MARALRGETSARPVCLTPPSGRHNWLNTQTPSFTWVELLQPGLSDSSFSQLGVVPGCSCPPGRRNCSDVKI